MRQNYANNNTVTRHVTPGYSVHLRCREKRNSLELDEYLRTISSEMNCFLSAESVAQTTVDEDADVV